MTAAAAIFPSRFDCQPERSLEMSGAKRQKQSKDAVSAATYNGDAGSFQVVVRFFDEHDAEMCPVPSREAATCESAARMCRVTRVVGASRLGTAPSSPAITK